jgi:uncharacterized membrane protein SpoIIM required for sporulation
MISRRWIEGRQNHWKRLEDLVQQARKGVHNLNGSELQELGLLYRQTASDLSTVVGDRANAQLAAYLNSLLGRSHNLLYTGKPASKLGILQFLANYPQVFRRNLALNGVATALFLAAALSGWAVSEVSPAFAGRFLGPAMIDSIEHRKMWTESVVAIKPVASSFITTNNLTVAFTTYALGITGVGTAWMMIFNGLMLGIVSEATWRAGMALSLWSFVAPHGVLELPAICIAGGAGLTLARGLLFPGLLPRKESLIRAGKESVQLVLGTIPMLLIAGTVEAFFSPTHAPVVMKFTLAGVLFTCLLVYLFGVRKPIRSGRGL